MRWYSQGLVALGKGLVDLTTGPIKVALFTASYVPDQNVDAVWTDISANEASGTGYSTGGMAITGVGWAYDAGPGVVKLTCDQIVFPTVTLSFRYTVVYASGGTVPLLGFHDHGSTQSPAAEDVALDPDVTGGLLQLGAF